MDFMNELRKKAIKSPRKIVFPEALEEKILRAAQLTLNSGIAFPILLGKKDDIVNLSQEFGIDLSGMRIVDPLEPGRLDTFVDEYCKVRDIPEGAARRILKKPLYFGAMMVKQGEADGMVAGLAHATEEVVMASGLIIGMQKGITTASSFFLMDIPQYTGGEDGLLIFADPAVNPDPSPEALADIAIASAASARDLLDWTPRVAMLSFSTKGSATHPCVDKVIQAVNLVKERTPEICVDGELQADAALVPEVARKKVKEASDVAGKANILIFPDLNSANISSKLVQRLGKANAYGPLLQGFAKPVSDLSRGATLEDIVGAAIMVVVKAQAQSEFC